MIGVTNPNRLVYPPEPGQPGGPHVEPCSCVLCTIKRRAAKKTCRICGQPIGFGNQVYLERGVPVHADCLEGEIAQKLEEPTLDADKAETIRAWLDGQADNLTLDAALKRDEVLHISGLPML